MHKRCFYRSFFLDPESFYMCFEWPFYGFHPYCNTLQTQSNTNINVRDMEAEREKGIKKQKDIKREDKRRKTF